MADKKISQLSNASTPLAGTEVLPIVQSGSTVKISAANVTAGRTVSALSYTSTVATGTAPLTVASTTEVANLRAANATSADSANAVKSNATTGVLQVVGPAAASTRVMTTPDANFTAARTDAAQSFTGDQTLATGNLVVGTSGKGIDFSATSSGSGTMTSELLDDYEEGTFTPVLTCATPGNLAVTYATQRGVYQVVGNKCTIWVNIQTDSLTQTTASGAVRISGLPFTNSLNGVESNIGGLAFQGITKADYTDFYVNAVWTTTYVQLIAAAQGQALANVNIGDLSTGVSATNLFLFQLSYIIS